MDVNKDFTSKETITSSLVTENCLICCAKTELFGTVKVFLLRGERTETRCLDTAYVGLPILLVMGRKGKWPLLKLCVDLTIGRSVTPIFLSMSHFLYRFSTLCEKNEEIY